MSRDLVISRGRAAAEQGMTDACDIDRLAGTVVDDDTGVVTPTYDAVHSGPCRLKQPASGANSASSATVGEAYVLLQQPELHLPMSAPLLRPGDRITITASRHDPGSVGRVLLVKAVPGHSQATARRYGVTERTS